MVSEVVATPDKARSRTFAGSRASLRLIPFILSLLVLGCATAPVQELSDARQALKAARAANGDLYTPEMMEQAEFSITQAVTRLSSGDYRQAREAALAAKHYAVLARQASLSVQALE